MKALRCAVIFVLVPVAMCMLGECVRWLNTTSTTCCLHANTTGLHTQCCVLVQVESLLHSPSHIHNLLTCSNPGSSTGVRARQERIPFATINDPDTLKQQVETLINSPVVLDVAAESVSLRTATDEEWAAAKAAGGAAKGAKAEGQGDAVAVVASPVSKVTKPRVVALLDASPETCGAKAAACAQLEEVRRVGAVSAGSVAVCRCVRMTVCEACSCVHLHACR